MGILQARSWGVCSMNEFRKFLSLKPFDTFEEWNPDPEIAVSYYYKPCSAFATDVCLFRMSPVGCMVISIISSSTYVAFLESAIQLIFSQTGLQCESLIPLSGGLRFAAGYTVSSCSFFRVFLVSSSPVRWPEPSSAMPFVSYEEIGSIPLRSPVSLLHFYQVAL